MLLNFTVCHVHVSLLKLCSVSRLYTKGMITPDKQVKSQGNGGKFPTQLKIKC